MYSQDDLRNANGSKSIYPIIYHNEEWKRIEFDDIKPIYWISNYGRVFSENTNCIMEPKITNSGYLSIGLRILDETKKFYLIHRLVLIMFNPIIGFEKLSANHINGNKFDNRIWNLEWVTIKENIHHAFDTGLRKTGGDLSFAIFTDNQIHDVCRCMQEGKSSYQIANEVFGSDLTRQLMHLFTTIYNKINWVRISDQYNISNFPRNNTFSDPQVKTICKLLSENPNISYKEILRILQIQYNSSKEYEKYSDSIRGIKKGKFYKHISSQYNI